MWYLWTNQAVFRLIGQKVHLSQALLAQQRHRLVHTRRDNPSHRRRACSRPRRRGDGQQGTLPRARDRPQPTRELLCGRRRRSVPRIHVLAEVGVRCVYPERELRRVCLFFKLGSMRTANADGLGGADSEGYANQGTSGRPTISDWLPLAPRSSRMASPLRHGQPRRLPECLKKRQSRGSGGRGAVQHRPASCCHRLCGGIQAGRRALHRKEAELGVAGR